MTHKLKYGLLLGLLILIGLPVQSFAQEVIKWGYCDNTIVSGYESEGETSAAIYIPAEVAKLYKGVKVVGVEVGLANDANDLTFFVKNSLDGNSLSGVLINEMSKGWQEAKFFQEYVIDGSGFYVGCTAKGSNIFGYTNGQNDNAYWMQTGDQEWTNKGATNQALSIRVMLERNENMPKDLAVCSVADVITVPGEAFRVNYVVANNGPFKVSKYTIEYTVGDQAPVQKEMSTQLQSGLLTPDSFVVDQPVDKVGTFPITIKILKIGKSEDKVKVNNTGSASISSNQQVFTRRFVLEEGTATWCGYCPKGLLASEKMLEEFPDTYIPIAVHVNDQFQPRDDKGVNSYLPLIKIGGGLPFAYGNRKRIGAVGDASFSDAHREALKHYAVANIEVESTFNIKDINSADKIKATAKLTFSMAHDDLNYRISFVLLERGLRAKQNDKYNLLHQGDDGWLYNDIARRNYSYDGFEGSVPPSVKAQEPITYTQTLDIPEFIKDKKNLYIVALLIDANSGEIMNANKVDVTVPTAIDIVDSDEVDVRYDGTRFVGTYDAIEVFNAQGCVVPNDSLRPGIYIVRVLYNNVYSTVKWIVE